MSVKSLNTGKEKGRLPDMDGLRMFAALLVFVFHLTWRAPMLRDNVRAVTGHLNVGVEIFFLLTGFLIWTPFARALATNSAFPSMGAYAAKRIVRIWPAYLLALAGAVATNVADPHGPIGYLKHITLTYWYFTDRGGDGLKVAWTLVVQVSFYLLAPFLARGLRALGLASRRVGVPIALIVFGGMFQVIARNGTVTWQPARILPPELLTIGMGMLLAGIVASPGAAYERRIDGIFRKVARRFDLCWILGTVTIGVLSFLVPDTGPKLALRTDDYLMQNLLQGLAAFWFVLPCVFPPLTEDASQSILLASRLQRLLRSRPVTWLGAMSFGFFLWHIPAFAWLGDSVKDDRVWVALPTWIAAIGISLALAAFSSRFVEKPATRWVDRKLAQ